MSIAISISNSIKGSLIPGGGVTPFVNDYSLSFDGNIDYLNGASTFSELDGGTQFTLSMWIKPTSLSSNRMIFHIPRNTTANNSQVLVFLRTSGQLDISVSTTATYCRSTTGAITSGVWQHLLIAFDLSQATNNKIRPFVNGVDVFSVANNPPTTFPTSSGAIYLGEEANGFTNPFYGEMDEVSLWNTDQRANISDIYNAGVPFDLSTLGTPPDHWWRMGDGDGDPTWSTSLTDNIGSYNLISSMPSGARVTDVP